MAELLATLIRGNAPKLGGAKAPMMRKENGAIVGEAWYRINTDTVDTAMKALALPAVGDRWSADYPGLLCRSVEINYVGGTSDPVSGLNGVCVAKCGYATPSGGRLPTPGQTVRYTRIHSSQSSFQRVYDVRYGTTGFPIRQLPPPQNENPAQVRVATPINGGRGASASYGSVQAEVVSYVPSGTLGTLLVRMIGLARRSAVNVDAVTLPPTIGLGTQGAIGFTLQPRQLRYSGFTIPDDAVSDPSGTALVMVTQQLEMAPDFYFRWQEEDQYGLAFGPIVESELYPAELFAGLW